MQFFMMLHRLSLLLGLGGMLVRLTAIVGFASRKKLGLAATGIYAISHGHNFSANKKSRDIITRSSLGILTLLPILTANGYNNINFFFYLPTFFCRRTRVVCPYWWALHRE